MSTVACMSGFTWRQRFTARPAQACQSSLHTAQQLFVRSFASNASATTFSSMACPSRPCYPRDAHWGSEVPEGQPSDARKRVPWNSKQQNVTDPKSVPRRLATTWSTGNACVTRARVMWNNDLRGCCPGDQGRGSACEGVSCGCAQSSVSCSGKPARLATQSQSGVTRVFSRSLALQLPAWRPRCPLPMQTLQPGCCCPAKHARR